jgi:hypothetical protein
MKLIKNETKQVYNIKYDIKMKIRLMEPSKYIIHTNLVKLIHSKNPHCFIRKLKIYTN